MFLKEMKLLISLTDDLSGLLNEYVHFFLENNGISMCMQTSKSYDAEYFASGKQYSSG